MSLVQAFVFEGEVMKQLTVRSVKSDLHNALKAEAARRGVSVNRVVIMLLREAVGLTNGSRQNDAVFDDLDYLAGTWTEVEAVEFEEQLASQRVIDEGMWS